MYELTPFHLVLLPFLGFILSALGTLVGLGGGFVLVPVLLFLFPEASPGTISSISLSVVFLNALSATIGNVRARRVDFRTAMLLTIGAIPAAIAGSMSAGMVSRDRFEIAFGVMLILGAVYVLWRSTRGPDLSHGSQTAPNREIRERRGLIYRFYVNTMLAGIISPLAGFVSSFFGIGGGVIHVPAMTFILKIPPRVVGATALFVLVPTSLVGVLTRVAEGQFYEGWRRAGLLGIGALFGAQLGLYLSTRVNQRTILILLAIAMVMVGIRQVVATV